MDLVTVDGELEFHEGCLPDDMRNLQQHKFHLLNRVEVVFHALDSMILAVFDVLGFEHLTAECRVNTATPTSLKVPSPFLATNRYL